MGFGTSARSVGKDGVEMAALRILLSPITWFRLLVSIRACGFNLMALLRFAAKNCGHRTALADEYETLTYRQLFSESNRLAGALHLTHRLDRGQKAAVLCRNHAALVKSIFAVSRLGADLYLLNTEMSAGQLQSLLERNPMDIILCDDELESKLEFESITAPICRIEPFVRDAKEGDAVLPRASLGRIVLFTGGTTEIPKQAVHQPSIVQYFAPFLALLRRLRLAEYSTAYIATPMFHGYGIAMLLVMTALGKKMIVTRRFTAQQACETICFHRAEVVSVVPLMLQRMLQHDVASLRSLRCIASGGASLSSKLVEQVQEQLGDVLYNLYGTSEGGLQVIATPEDLRRDPRVLGRKIRGVALRVREGRLFVRRNRVWIANGDAGYRDRRGYYYLLGRADDMAVSGGEKVYPIELEQVLMRHPEIADAAVAGVPDEMYGSRLKAWVLLSPASSLTAEELAAWLKTRVARYQMPKEIVFVESIPYTPLGKVDKKKLYSP